MLKTKYLGILNELTRQSQDPSSYVSGSAFRFFLFDEIEGVSATIVVGSNGIYHKESGELYKGEDNFIRLLNWLEAQLR